MIVNSYISSRVDAAVEGSRAVQTDCNVWKDINRDIDVINFPVPNNCVIQDLLWLVLHKGCEVEHFGRVLQDTNPADRPVGRVGSDLNDVMQHFRSGFVHHRHLSSIGSVSKGEVQHDVFLGRSVEEDERVSGIQHDGCAVLDPVCDVDAANLVDFRQHLSGEVSVIELRTPVTHRNIKMEVLGGCSVGVSGRQVENCPVVVSAVNQNSSCRGVRKPCRINRCSCVQTGNVENQGFPFCCV